MAVAVGAGMMLSGSAVAQGAVTVGANFANGTDCTGQFSLVDTTYAVPSAGTVTSFAFQSQGSAGYVIAFKVWRSLGGASYQVVGSTDPVTIATDTDLEVFILPLRSSSKPATSSDTGIRAGWRTAGTPVLDPCTSPAARTEV